MFCENYGAQINADAKFCRACGASVDKSASQQAPRHPPATEPDWDSLEYDGETVMSDAEVEELFSIATEEEIEEYNMASDTMKRTKSALS